MAYERHPEALRPNYDVMKNYYIILLAAVTALSSCTTVRYASDSNAEFDDIYYISTDSDPVPVTLEDDYADYRIEEDANQEDYWEGERSNQNPGSNNGNTYIYNYNRFYNSPWGMTPNPYYGWGYYPGFTFNISYNNFYHRWRPYCGIGYSFNTFYPFSGSYFYGYGPYYDPWFYDPFYDPFYNPIGYCYNPWVHNPYWYGYAYGYGGYYNGSDVYFTGNGAYYGQNTGFSTGSIINSTYTQGAIFDHQGKVVASVKPVNPSKPVIEKPITAIGASRKPISPINTQSKPQINVDRPTNPSVRPVNPDRPITPDRPSTNGNTRPTTPKRPTTPRPTTRPAQPDRPSGGTRPSTTPRDTPKTQPSRNRGGGLLLGALLNVGSTTGTSRTERESYSNGNRHSTQSGSLNRNVSNNRSSSSRSNTSSKSSRSAHSTSRSNARK